jgi:hypothetical protein
MVCRLGARYEICACFSVDQVGRGNVRERLGHSELALAECTRIPAVEVQCSEASSLMAQREREGRSDSFGERSARDVGIPVAVLQVGHADHGAAGVGGTAWPIAQLSLECFASQRRLIGRGHVVLFARPVADGVSDAIRYAGSRHSRVSLSGAEPVPAASEAEVPRSLEVGTDPCMALTDLGALQVGVKCMEHRSMSFLSRIGTLVGARDDARIRRSGAPTAQCEARTVR